MVGRVEEITDVGMFDEWALAGMGSPDVTRAVYLSSVESVQYKVEKHTVIIPSSEKIL